MPFPVLPSSCARATSSQPPIHNRGKVSRTDDGQDRYAERTGYVRDPKNITESKTQRLAGTVILDRALRLKSAVKLHLASCSMSFDLDLAIRVSERSKFRVQEKESRTSLNFGASPMFPGVCQFRKILNEVQEPRAQANSLQ